MWVARSQVKQYHWVNTSSNVWTNVPENCYGGEISLLCTSCQSIKLNSITAICKEKV